VKTRVNWPDFFEKLSFQDKILSKDTILSIFAPVTPKFFFAKKQARKKFGRRLVLEFLRPIFFSHNSQTIFFIPSKVSLIKKNVEVQEKNRQSNNLSNLREYDQVVYCCFSLPDNLSNRRC